MVYFDLLRHQRKAWVRSLRFRHRWPALLALGFGGLYLAAALFFGGLYIQRLIIADILPGEAAVPLVNQFVLTGLLGLIPLRYFLQRAPRLDVTPYLHLPIRRGHLVRYIQFTGLLSLLNVFPLMFIGPFWVRHILGVYGDMGAWLWLGGALALLWLSHLANLLLRALMGRDPIQFFSISAVLLALLVVDQFLTGQYIHQASFFLFATLLEGNALMLAGLVVPGVALHWATARVLRRGLHEAESVQVQQRAFQPLAFAPGGGVVRNLILLELKMMWRNRRPRHYFLTAVVLGVLYVGFLLAEGDRSSVLLAIVGVFASGIFTLNYGQLMFSWESVYFDGFLCRPLAPRRLMQAKLLLLMGSCLGCFLLNLPLFLWLAPDLLGLHIAFLFYNTGVSCTLVLMLALSNRKRIDTAQGGLLNYEGISLVHWLWTIPTLVPPALVLAVFGPSQWTALVVIGGVGLLSTVLLFPWTHFFADRLAVHRHDMAAGFRAYAR